MIRILPWLLLTISAFEGQTWAYDVFSSGYLYELGFYGLYPTASFKSSDLSPPRLNFPRWDEQKCSDGYYLIAQKGKIVSETGPTILDSRGELVWADDSYGVVFNFQIQAYKGENYITFWSNPDGSSHGYGRGTYYMLDSSYELFRKFEAAGEGLKGDLHEFHITDHGTALMTVYNPVPADLTSVGGPKQGWALDCLVQEIDIDTGDLVFEWSAIEHVALNETVRSFAGEDDGTTPETAFDFFHLNSIDEDSAGNYVISGRHTSTVLCISHDGSVLWTLGGALNTFHDLSDGHATDFMYQHHVRLHGNGDAGANATTLSIFDNAASERAGQASRHDHSRGLIVQLDTTNMTATLVQEFVDPENPRTAVSQGSMQVLDDSVVLGYGWLPFITEFAADGSVLCSIELAPWVAARWGLVNSYRAFKARDWVGRPREPPSIYLNPGEGQVFVSWNGATEVQRWVLQGTEWAGLHSLNHRERHTEEETETGFIDLDDMAKESFETFFDLTDDMPRYLRIAAVNSEGNVLMHSQILDRYVGNATQDWVHSVLIWAAVLLIAAIALVAMIRRRARRAIWGNSSRGYDLLARCVSVCRDQVARTLSTTRDTERESGRGRERNIDAEDDAESGIYERYPAMRWWRDWGGAKAHELEPVYHD